MVSTDDVFLVTFPLIEHPGKVFGVVVERSDYHDLTEEEVKEHVITEIENCDPEEAGDYPEDLNIDPDDVTCRRMSQAEAELASKGETYVNVSWWG
jgi:hypothetical protein